MASLVVWAVLVVVALLLGLIAHNFSLRTVRWVSAITAVIVVCVITRYGIELWFQDPQKAPPSNLVDALTDGVDASIKDLLRPLLFGYQESPPGPIGRGVAALLILLGYRGLEAWTMRRQAPQLISATLSNRNQGVRPASLPADVRGEGYGSDTYAQLHDQLTHELKFRLAAIEVRAPAILPGGSRTNGLASIAEASGVNGAGMAGAVIRFIGSIWPSPRRLQLRVWVEPPAEPAASPQFAGIQVTVYLENPRNGATVATKTLACADIDEAASMVAGYVARQVFIRDPSTPPWCYGRADGRDLGALLLARLERVQTETAEAVQASRKTQIEKLRDWASTGRSAGVARYELAQLLDLDGDHLGALRLHALNREQYPRFYRGRYRLGMSLEMIASNECVLRYDDDTERELDQILGLLSRQRLTSRTKSVRGELKLCDNDKHHCQLPQSLRLDLLNAAATVLGEVRAQLSLKTVVWNTIRHRSERAVWLPYWAWLPGQGLRRRWAFQDGVRVAELLVAIRMALTQAEIDRSPDHTESHEASNDVTASFTKDPRHYEHAIKIVAVIAQESDIIRRVLDKRTMHVARESSLDTAMPLLDRPTEGNPSPGTSTEPPKRTAALWLHRRRGKASWQAAYNAACMYAALARQSRVNKDQAESEEAEWVVVRCLLSAIDNPHSEMERPYDWISRDPDLSCLSASSTRISMPNTRSPFKKFLDEQKWLDYPRERFSDVPQTVPQTVPQVTHTGVPGDSVTGDALGKYAIPKPAGPPTAQASPSATG